MVLSIMGAILRICSYNEMLIEVLFFSFCTLVSPLQIPIAEYPWHINSGGFHGGNCENESPWLVTEYKTLGIVPFTKHNTKCIQATSRSCVSTYPIVFSSGLELSVYLQLFLNDSVLIVTVFDQNNVTLLEYEYKKLNKGYVEGWSKIVLNPGNDFVGYITLKGRTDNEDIILIDSIQHNSTKKSDIEPTTTNTDSKTSLATVRTIVTNNLKILNIDDNKIASKSQPKDRKRNDWLNTYFTNRSKRSNTIEAENNKAVNTLYREYYKEVDGTEASSPPTMITSTSDSESKPETNADIVGSTSTTSSSVDSTISTNSINVTDATSHPGSTILDQDRQQATASFSTSKSDSTTSETNALSNAIVITLIVIGGLVVFGITTVTAYHCGKIRARKDNNIDDIIIEEDIQPQTIIPRVRNTINYENNSD